MKGPLRALKIDVRVHDQSHHHRRLGDILEILKSGSLPSSVRDQAASIFRRLAEAEGRVHGTPPADIHFHEVGAVDAIVDITGTCIGLARLGVEAVHCSALPVGGGFVDSAHGRIPIPAPGTAELLRGMPLVDTGVRRELVTPTGAAILSTLARSAGSMPAMTVEAIGYGAGTIDLPTPNVIRLFIGEARAMPAAGPELETICQIETTVDDMSPQLWEPVIETLFEAGALDVYLTPVIMKRSRPGVVLTALCDPARVPELARTLLEASTTIGVRWTNYQRRRLPREMVSLPTAHGPISFKVSRLDGRVVTVTPEFEEVRRIARDKGLPVREVLDCARAEGRRLLDP
jgi:pyridinium-3,5-bisthiocarboxylic acid mononucleotide nickel chelatase